MSLAPPKYTIKTNGYSMRLVQWDHINPTPKGTHQAIALYAQYNNSHPNPIAYEVHILKHQTPNEYTTYTWKHPANNTWGTTGWTFHSKTLALTKYHQYLP